MRMKMNRRIPWYAHLKVDCPLCLKKYDDLGDQFADSNEGRIRYWNKFTRNCDSCNEVGRATIPEAELFVKGRRYR